MHQNDNKTAIKFHIMFHYYLFMEKLSFHLEEWGNEENSTNEWEMECNKLKEIALRYFYLLNFKLHPALKFRDKKIKN